MPDVRHAALVAACASAVVAAGSGAAEPAAYPERAVRMVVPFPAGGPNDTLARILGQKLAEQWRHNVVVDNRGGGSGIIGTEIAARAVPDGHTLIMVGSNIATNVSVYAKLPYDVRQDFAPVTQVAATPYLLVVHPSLGVATVAELVAAARSRPKGLSYASASTGAANHLAGELFNRIAGVNMVHVPYKGGGPALADVIAGHVHLIFNNPLTALGHVRSGRLRALAVTSLKRSAVAPELPTVAESGVPGFDVTGWYGMLAPARTPRRIVEQLYRDMAAIVGTTQMRERLVGQGLEPVASRPGEFAAHIASEIGKWGRVVADAGVRMER